MNIKCICASIYMTKTFRFPDRTYTVPYLAILANSTIPSAGSSLPVRSTMSNAKQPFNSSTTSGQKTLLQLFSAKTTPFTFCIRVLAPPSKFHTKANGASYQRRFISYANDDVRIEAIPWPPPLFQSVRYKLLWLLTGNKRNIFSIAKKKQIK